MTLDSRHFCSFQTMPAADLQQGFAWQAAQYLNAALSRTGRTTKLTWFAVLWDFRVIQSCLSVINLLPSPSGGFIQLRGLWSGRGSSELDSAACNRSKTKHLQRFLSYEITLKGTQVRAMARKWLFQAREHIRCLCWEWRDDDVVLDVKIKIISL